MAPAADAASDISEASKWPSSSTSRPASNWGSVPMRARTNGRAASLKSDSWAADLFARGGDLSSGRAFDFMVGSAYLTLFSLAHVTHDARIAFAGRLGSIA